MTGLIVLACVVLLVVIVVQIGRITELAAKIRGEEASMEARESANSKFLYAFMVVFLLATVYTSWHYKNMFLGYGPLQPASEHGGSIDRIFNITLFFTGIVFILTHIALFYFAYKYRRRKGQNAIFLSHDNRLEIIWTIVPAIVMALLVIGGLDTWNTVMADVKEGEDFIEIEATGYQFAWAIRYPGRDGLLGEKDYLRISGTNQLGQNWNDTKNIDDFQPTDIVLPVGKQVRVRITAKDVLHNFYLPHFRLKMDAVPGMPTYFVFRPTITTEEYRQRLREYPEWQVPADPNDPEGPQRWETFNFELACAELCGNGHYSMRKIVRIVSQEAYEDWLADQEKTAQYIADVRGTEEDPFAGQIVKFEELLQLSGEAAAARAELLKAAEADAAAKSALDEANKHWAVLRVTNDLDAARKAAAGIAAAKASLAVSAAQEAPAASETENGI